MFPTPKRWLISDRLDNNEYRRFLDLYPNSHPLVAQILLGRGFGIEKVQAFLDHKADGDDNPFGLKGMEEAVERLQAAIVNGELIAIYGDYDADGVTATALLTQALAAFGGRTHPFIPDRFKDGYGLNNDSIGRLAQEEVQLLVTVDCGIRSAAEVNYAAELGLDVVITDHHGPLPEVPDALAIINPKQPDCPYPFKQLAGVGLAFKVAQALQSKMDPISPLDEDDLLDLVAVGTVADLAPLTGENRQLVTNGIRRLNKSPHVGLKKLMEQSGIKMGTLTSESIGFGLGPRLNAAGRLGSAEAAFELLVTDDVERAAELAEELNALNEDRKAKTTAAVGIARDFILADQNSNPLYMLAEPWFHPGIVGLVSGRLTDEFYVPTLVAQRGEVNTRGSARSIPEFHITNALDACSDLLERHGGHSMAAGFTVKNDNLLALHTRLLEIAHEQLDSLDLSPSLEIDTDLNLQKFDLRQTEGNLARQALGHPVNEDDHGLQIVKALDSLRPFGAENPVPVFASFGLKVAEKRQVGAEGQHLSLRLYDGKQSWKAIAFHRGDWFEDLSGDVNVAYELDVNNWTDSQGQIRVNLQLKILDIQSSNGESDE